MTKPVSISKKPRKQHTPEFRNEALKLAERIGVAAAARELSLYESQLYAWRSKQQQQMSSSSKIIGQSSASKRCVVYFGLPAAAGMSGSGVVTR